MKPIFLIGFMGCGKSTLGRALGRATGLDFIDLDLYIEGRYRKNVRDIFATEGEERFRDMERRMLREVGEFENTIIACGGGTPCFYDNIDYMNARGLTVWLDAGIDRTYQRLLVGRYKRPSIANKTDEELLQFIEESIERRQPFYSQAQATFASDRLDSRSEIDDTVATFVKRFINQQA